MSSTPENVRAAYAKAESLSIKASAAAAAAAVCVDSERSVNDEAAKREIYTAYVKAEAVAASAVAAAYAAKVDYSAKCAHSKAIGVDNKTIISAYKTALKDGVDAVESARIESAHEESIKANDNARAKAIDAAYAAYAVYNKAIIAADYAKIAYRAAKLRCIDNSIELNPAPESDPTHQKLKPRSART